jgi:hypothetical protein
LGTLNQYEELCQHSCCPVFLVALTGTDLVIWGAVTAERFFFEPLVSVLLDPMPRVTDRTAVEDKMLEVANVFRALKKGVDELKKHYDDLPRPSPVPTTDRGVGSRTILTRSGGRSSSSGGHTSRSAGRTTNHTEKYIAGMFPRWCTFKSDSKEYKLQYVRRLPMDLAKPVFLAKMTGGDCETGKDVVVKFASSYCPDAHKLLWKEGLAPELYYAEKEVCAEDKPNAPDMWVVVMEYIKGAPPSGALGEKLKEKLTKCVNVLHKAGYVHGDLRPPNVLVRDDKLFLVDFDWANTRGTARYPLHISLSPEKNWHPGVTRGGLIEYEHDNHRLESLVSGLG